MKNDELPAVKVLIYLLAVFFLCVFSVVAGLMGSMWLWNILGLAMILVGMKFVRYIDRESEDKHIVKKRF